MENDAIRRAAAAAVGRDIEILEATAQGESKSTLNARVGDVEVVLKVLTLRPEVVRNQERLIRLVNHLRGLGYPAPEYFGVGCVRDVVVTAQRRLPGQTLDPAPGKPVNSEVLWTTLPSILEVVELQAGAGDLPEPPWPDWLLDTLTSGGDGYCMHSTMRRRPDTSALLDRVIRFGIDRPQSDPPSTDIMHFDLNPANVLHQAGTLTGIVDWNVPFVGASQGDRGFDVATLLFYTYDIEASRDQLWQRTLAISGGAWTAVYLAHLVLRQVEWTVRHRPGSDEERRFMSISERILAECDAIPS